jgi:uncharacterized membrane protein
MKQSKLFYWVFPFIIMTIPWIYLAFTWNEIPQTIPIHFGISGKADKFGSKDEIFAAPAVLTIVGIAMYFILQNIYKIDPKKKYTATTSAVLAKLSIVMIILLCAVSLAIIYWSVKGKMEGLPVLFCGLSLFFAYIGNLMHSIKPNYFAGFRVPWALENEENWRKTHQLASKIWFTGGLTLAIVSLLVSLKLIIIVFMAGVFLMTIIPVIYSYNLYRRSLDSSNKNQFL